MRTILTGGYRLVHQSSVPQKTFRNSHSVIRQRFYSFVLACVTRQGRLTGSLWIDRLNMFQCGNGGRDPQQRLRTLVRLIVMNCVGVVLPCPVIESE